jgi:hypothetical protein
VPRELVDGRLPLPLKHKAPRAGGPPATAAAATVATAVCGRGRDGRRRRRDVQYLAPIVVVAVSGNVREV